MQTLFVEADEPLLVFPSIKVAERYLEAADVRDGVYRRAFGSSGEQFLIAVVDDAVVISPSDAPPDIGGLKALLLQSLAAVGEPMPETTELPTLIALAEAFWNERDPMGDRFSKPIPWWGCLLIVIGAVALLSLFWR